MAANDPYLPQVWHFNPILAKRISVPAAMIYEWVRWSCADHAKRKQKQFLKKDRWWMIETLAGFAERIQFWDEKTVRRAIIKLREEELICTYRGQRGIYYALFGETGQNVQSGIEENGETGQNVQSGPILTGQNVHPDWTKCPLPSLLDKSKEESYEGEESNARAREAAPPPQDQAAITTHESCSGNVEPLHTPPFDVTKLGASLHGAMMKRLPTSQLGLQECFEFLAQVINRFKYENEYDAFLLISAMLNDTTPWFQKRLSKNLWWVMEPNQDGNGVCFIDEIHLMSIETKKRQMREAR